MCTGRIDLAFLLRAFLKGADGLLVVGCHLNECNYLTQGNFYAMSVVHLCKKLLERTGLKSERLRMGMVSGGDAHIFVNMVKDFSKTIHELGPLGVGEGIEKEEMKKKLESMAQLVPYIKLEMREKLTVHLQDADDYNRLYSTEEIEGLLNNVISYYVDPAKCQACMMCAKNCPVEAIEGGKKRIHVVDQEKCIKCGKCFETCPPRFGAVMKISGRPVPPAIPDDERTIDRRRKGK